MKVTFIPIVICVLGTVTERLLKGLEDMEIRGRMATIKLLHYWDRPEYCEKSWRLEETCCHSNPCERPSAYAELKNSQGVNNNNNNKCEWVGKGIHWKLCKNWSLTQQTNDKCTNKNISQKMRGNKFSRTNGRPNPGWKTRTRVN